jgi:hypothetical protein
MIKKLLVSTVMYSLFQVSVVQCAAAAQQSPAKVVFVHRLTGKALITIYGAHLLNQSQRNVIQSNINTDTLKTHNLIVSGPRIETCYFSEGVGTQDINELLDVVTQPGHIVKK